MEGHRTFRPAAFVVAGRDLNPQPVGYEPKPTSLLLSKTGSAPSCCPNFHYTQLPAVNIDLTQYQVLGKNGIVAQWEVEFTDDFGAWWDTLTEDEQESIAASVGLLSEAGPALDHPHTSKIQGSRHGRMRELRVSMDGRSASSTVLTRAASACF
jgi:hypothetical protein